MQTDEEIIEHFLRVSRIAFGLPIAATKQQGRESNSADWSAATLSSAEFSFGKGLMSTSRHELNLNEAQRTEVSSIYYQRISSAREARTNAHKRREELLTCRIPEAEND